mmetsp:Transcript_74159/g.206141  ORF Transcript_74159/g.206141 Transcript_74159/m.206141 type:complete len:206 (-) Transcript_74159:13-630(-)
MTWIGDHAVLGAQWLPRTRVAHAADEHHGGLGTNARNHSRHLRHLPVAVISAQVQDRGVDSNLVQTLFADKDTPKILLHGEENALPGRQRRGEAEGLATTVPGEELQGVAKFGKLCEASECAAVLRQHSHSGPPLRGPLPVLGVEARPALDVREHERVVEAVARAGGHAALQERAQGDGAQRHATQPTMRTRMRYAFLLEPKTPT